MDEQARGQIRAALVDALKTTVNGMTFNELCAECPVSDDRAEVMGVLRLMQQERKAEQRDHRYFLSGSAPAPKKTAAAEKSQRAAPPDVDLEQSDDDLNDAADGPDISDDSPVTGPTVALFPVTHKSPAPAMPAVRTEDNHMQKQSRSDQTLALSGWPMNAVQVAAKLKTNKGNAGVLLRYMEKKGLVRPVGRSPGAGAAKIYEPTGRSSKAKKGNGAAGPARAPGKRKTPDGLVSEKVRGILQRAVEQAQDNLDEYLISVADPAVYKTLQAARDAAKRNLEAYLVKA